VWAYADLQVLGDAITATNSLNDDVLTDYLRETTFKTVVGDVKFGKHGEWVEERTLRLSSRTSRATASMTSAI
jgi:branched-chain amino acid transport system substrate-binding protein